MRLENFINQLQLSGWHGTNDAQHENISKLHRRLFPVIAEMEEYLEESEKNVTILIESIEAMKVLIK